MPIRGERSRVVLQAIFPRGDNAARHETHRRVHLHFVHARRPGAASGLHSSLPPSLPPSNYRRQTALFWIIDCTKMRRYENATLRNAKRNRIATPNICGLAMAPTCLLFIIYRLDYCYRSTWLRAKWDFDRHHGKMRASPPLRGFYEREFSSVSACARAKLNWN